MLRASRSAFIVLAIITWSVFAHSAPKPPPKPRQKNGIRLVGGSGPKGRLEISSKDGWLTRGTGTAWRPVCDDAGFNDDAAQVMCKLLGYSYGMKFFSPSVNYRPPNASVSLMDNPVGYIYCNRNSGGRRLLPGDVSPANSVDGAGAGDELAAQGRYLGGAKLGHGRALLAPLTGTINIPRQAKYTCGFRLGGCDFTGPLVGLQCSGTPLPPAPPPPPVPPVPPPSPPPRSTHIRLVGGRYGSSPTHIEPNICGDTNSTGCSFARVEVLVNASTAGGGPMWAPLCAGQNATVSTRLALLVCMQAMDYPGGFPLSLSWYPYGQLRDTPFTIPQVAASASDFNASSYEAWVTVTGGRFNTAKMVQDLDFQVSASPCSNGFMFTVLCGVHMA